MFFKQEIGTLEGILDVKPRGKKMKVMEKLQKLKEQYDKEGYVKYIDSGLLDDVEPTTLKFVRSHTIGSEKKNRKGEDKFS